jgi:hypothetical protein
MSGAKSWRHRLICVRLFTARRSILPTLASAIARSWKPIAKGERLAALARQQPLTLLYAAKNTRQNHAQVLADWLKAL